jgi:hypothetical protein
MELARRIMTMNWLEGNGEPSPRDGPVVSLGTIASDAPDPTVGAIGAIGGSGDFCREQLGPWH